MARVTFGTFSLDPPPEWTLSSIILSGPVEAQLLPEGILSTRVVRPFQRNLIATMEQVGPDVTAESYVDRQIKGLRDAGVPREEVAEQEDIELAGGDKGLITEQVIVGANGERVRQMQLVVIKQGIAHILIASHLDGTPFEAVRTEFRKMLESFS